MYKCSIYEDRPQLCRDFPRREVDILNFPSCSYWFDGNKIYGECGRCGQCCKLTKQYKGICPYLELISDKEAN